MVQEFVALIQEVLIVERGKPLQFRAHCAAQRGAFAPFPSSCMSFGSTGAVDDELLLPEEQGVPLFR